MDKFFNSDNMVMRTLSKIFDIGWLTLIYLVFCIPIVTVGAATTSCLLYTSISGHTASRRDDFE